MPVFSSRRRFALSGAPALLATTSVAALLLGASAPALAAVLLVNGKAVASVTNPANTTVSAIAVLNSTVTGAVTNAGTITPAIVPLGATGMSIANSTVGGGVASSGTLTVNGAGGIGIGIGAFNSSMVSNGLSNSGTLTVSNAATGLGIVLNAATLSGGITNSAAITTTGTINAVGIAVSGLANVISGGISNSGTITATGKTVGIGIAISGNSPVAGGITNTGTITGSTAAISLAGETGVSNTVTQAGGTIAGNIIGSGNTKSDVLNLAGGQIVLAPNQSISGFGTYNQTGGTLVFNVTASNTAGAYPTLTANAINLKGGTFELVPAQRSLGALASQVKTVFPNAIKADPPLTGSFANVTSPVTLFTASTQPDATTPNSLDAVLTLNQQAVVASAQNLRLGLDAPRVLTEAIQDRLIANGGALGEGWSASATAKGAASFAAGSANVWARGYDQFGSGSAPSSSPSVGFNINRAAPIIAGVDWRLDNNIVAGASATYVASTVKFKDGSHTNANSYQAGAYGGWGGDRFYALGSAVVSFNDFSISRVLTPFGLVGDASSSPSGQSYHGHAESGYHWVLAAGGANLSVTPYAALDYVNAHVQGFSEAGGFGALTVNATSSNSFQTTLGVRLTGRMVIGNVGTFIPELRVGWNHEFLDTSQTVTAALIGVPGSSFSSAGLAFGRDAALIGAGLNLELSPDAKVFVDYDGRIGSRLQEHSVSGGLKVRF